MMEKLRKMEPQKLAVLIIVLGLVGVLLAASANLLVGGIVLVVVQAILVFFIINTGSEQAQEKTTSDKYRKLFKNLPIGFAQAKIIKDATGSVTGYQVEHLAHTSDLTEKNLLARFLAKVISKFFRI